MTLVIIFSGFFLVALFVMVGAVQQSKPQSHRPVGAEWLSEMSLERYKPMLRLLDPTDLDNLATQPGFKPALTARLRRQRCDAFERYVASLSADFDRAMLFAAAAAAQKSSGRPELAAVCARAGRQFRFRRFLIQQRVALYRRFGIGTVEADGLVALFELLAAELHLARIAARSREYGFQVSTSHAQRPYSCLQ